MKKILYVLHSGITGGTFLTNKDLMKHVESEYEVYLLSAEKDFFRLYSYKKGNLNVLKDYPRHLKLNSTFNGKNNEYNHWNAVEFHNSWYSFIYFDILQNFEIDIIHIRHLINHSFDLPYIAKKLNIPIILSMHDFYFLCPFYTLLDENNKYCGGYCSDNDKNCYVPMPSLNNINSKKVISSWRENVLRLFSNIDYFITTSEFVKNLFLSFYKDKNILNSENFIVIEHGRDFPAIKKNLLEMPDINKPIKILCVANHLNIMKGANLVKRIKMEDKQNNLEFHFLGNCYDDLENYGIYHGIFERDLFYKKVEEIKPSFIGIFSIWPETFCHTLTEAWSCGIPVIGTDIGVVKDRILKNNGGWIFNRNNPNDAIKLILSLVNNINNVNDNSYLNIIDNINKMNLKSTKKMSEEYLSIYNYALKKVDNIDIIK